MAAPADKLTVAFIGKGGFAQFQQKLLTEKLSSKIAIGNIYDTTKKYPEGEQTQALYIVSPDNHHKTLLDEALKKGQHKLILLEKPGFFNETEFLFSLQNAMEFEVDVFINFQRRYDPMYEHARALYQEKLKIACTDEDSYDLIFESADPVPHEPNQAVKYLHNSIIHDIDSAIWFNWPFSEAHLSYCTYSGAPDHKMELEITFTRRLGQKNSKATIYFSKGNDSYLNKIEIVRQNYTTLTFSEEFKAEPFFNRYIEAYSTVWNKFFEYSKVVYSEDEMHHNQDRLSLHHHSYSYTYRILGQAIKSMDVKK